MELRVFGSSSKGNGYALVDSLGNVLILECGVRIAEIQKSLGFNISKVVAALVTHEHLDHSKYIGQYIQYGIDIYAPEAVFKRHKLSGHHRAKVVGSKHSFAAPPFEVRSFDVMHDVPTLGYMVRHEEMGLTIFATDTYYLPYTFKNVDHWIIEANYDKEVMDDRAQEGEENIALRNRIVQSHMSIENLIRMLKANDLSMSKNIVITHLSDRNSHELRFILSLQEAFGKPVHVADPGKIINLSLTPF